MKRLLKTIERAENKTINSMCEYRDSVVNALKEYGEQQVREYSMEEEAGAELVVKEEEVPYYIYVDAIKVNDEGRVLVSATRFDGDEEPEWIDLWELNGVDVTDIAPHIMWNIPHPKKGEREFVE